MRIQNQFVFSTIFALGWAIAGPAAAQEVQWRTDYAAAAREAAEKHRPMFLDVYMVTCPPCNKLDLITYRDAALAKLLNDKFIPVKIDGEINAVDVQGQRVQAFPTLFFLAADGNVLAKFAGFTEPANLLQMAHQALGAPVAAKKEVVAFQAQAKVGPGAAYRSNVWKGARQFCYCSAFSADPISARDERILRAREILVQAVDNFRKQQWLPCLEQTRVLIVYYPDLPESADARQLAGAISPESLDKLGKDLIENLGQVYWELAQQKMRLGQTSQAIGYFEKILQSCPGTRYAAPAQEIIHRHNEPAPSPTKISVKITSR